jgi:hypothetical protein
MSKKICSIAQILELVRLTNFSSPVPLSHFMQIVILCLVSYMGFLTISGVVPPGLFILKKRKEEIMALFVSGCSKII